MSASTAAVPTLPLAKIPTTVPVTFAVSTPSASTTAPGETRETLPVPAVIVPSRRSPAVSANKILPFRLEASALICPAALSRSISRALPAPIPPPFAVRVTTVPSRSAAASPAPVSMIPPAAVMSIVFPVESTRLTLTSPAAVVTVTAPFTSMSFRTIKSVSAIARPLTSASLTVRLLISVSIALSAPVPAATPIEPAAERLISTALPVIFSSASLTSVMLPPASRVTSPEPALITPRGKAPVATMSTSPPAAELSTLRIVVGVTSIALPTPIPPLVAVKLTDAPTTSAVPLTF